MKKNICNLLFLFLFVFSTTAQSDTTKSQSWQNEKFQSGVIAEVGYQRLPFMSLGALVGHGFGVMDRTSVGGGVAFDVLYNGTNTAFGPRVFLMVNMPKSIGVRVGVADYRKERSEIDDFRMNLEVTYLLKGLIGLNVGLSFPVTKQYHEEIGAIRGGIIVNLAR